MGAQMTNSHLSHSKWVSHSVSERRRSKVTSLCFVILIFKKGLFRLSNYIPVIPRASNSPCARDQIQWRANSCVIAHLIPRGSLCRTEINLVCVIVNTREDSVCVYFHFLAQNLWNTAQYSAAEVTRRTRTHPRVTMVQVSCVLMKNNDRVYKFPITTAIVY